MGTRRVIDQAIGLIMAQNRCSADEAFDILRRASQNRNLKINRLASDMIRTVTGSEPDPDLHWQA
jgi:AmiR/NasT family two-component response regulator